MENVSGRIQGTLLFIAGVFVTLYSVALTFSPIIRYRSWSVDLRWEHWLGWAIWVFGFTAIHKITEKRLKNHDPFLIPITGMLTGIGTITIWRLLPGFGLRQSLWLGIGLAILYLGSRFSFNLSLLRRYKYLWLTSGLALTSLTFLFGTNPSASEGPRLWLGCCGFYLQPSEPLKLLLIIFLSAYLADHYVEQIFHIESPQSQLINNRLLSSPILALLGPTIVMTALSLAILIFQRDLGTATIFLLIYAGILYLATGKRRLLIGLLIITLLAAFLGYQLFDVVKVRFEAWWNPWLDPSNRSFQIVQSLIAIADGGLLGHGPGLGNPAFVPVAHSDFIFTSIVEELGILGAYALILCFAFLIYRGFRIAINAQGVFLRYLAAGITLYFSVQSILILGGNIRLLPLTGVTLPFLSYGGSSLVTSLVALFFLLIISQESDRNSHFLPEKPYLQVTVFLWLGLLAIAFTTGWWAVVRGNSLTSRTDNPRRTLSDRFVKRGSLIDRNGHVISASDGKAGEITRQILIPGLSNIVGYTQSSFGQSGLEASLDPFLRGLSGIPYRDVEMNYLLFGQPPPGLDVQLSLDSELQQQAQALFENQTGALVLFSADRGEPLVLLSNPSFDANRLDQDWGTLVSDSSSPLVNRTSQGSYPPGSILGPFILAKTYASGIDLDDFPQSFSTNDLTSDCALPPTSHNPVESVQVGCPGVVSSLTTTLNQALNQKQAIQEFLASLNFFSPVTSLLPASQSTEPPSSIEPDTLVLGLPDQRDPNSAPFSLKVSPLQVAYAATFLSNEGNLPGFRLATGIKIPSTGWAFLPPDSQAISLMDPLVVSQTVNALRDDTEPIWSVVSLAHGTENTTITWYLAGTIPEKNMPKYVVVVLLEEPNPLDASTIGKSLLNYTLTHPLP